MFSFAIIEEMKKITFLNQPKFSENKVDQVRNEIKRELVPKVEEYISNHKLFKDKEVNITFAQEGSNSLVAVIETEDKKYVLKISVSKNQSEAEVTFLKVWEQDGVSVPHVIEEGLLNQRSFILMNFVEADILGKAYSPEEMLSRNIFVELGSILSKMHLRSVKGYGFLRDGHPEYRDFSEWSSKLATSRFAYIKEHSILNNEEHGSITKSIDIIERYLVLDDRSTYCHNDFTLFNAFATNPITIFDPSPAFAHPYIDLGLAIVLMVSMYEYDSDEVVRQLIEGYFGNKTIDLQVIHAFVVFNSHTRIPRWHMTNRLERIVRMQKYLNKNKSRLGS